MNNVISLKHKYQSIKDLIKYVDIWNLDLLKKIYQKFVFYHSILTD